MKTYCAYCKQELQFFPAYYISLDDPIAGESHASATFCTQRCLRKGMSALFDEGYGSYQLPIMTRARAYVRQAQAQAQAMER